MRRSESPGRPLGSLVFLGPTGTGKTRLVEAAAEILFGNPRAMIKVDCGGFRHSHEIAELVGSPQGYLGHREIHPVLTQEALEQFHTEKLALNFLLFDEIEKASDALWQLPLGILDKATLTLGDNRRVDLSRTLVFLTSNLGASGIIRFDVRRVWVHRCNRQARGRPGTKGGPNRGGGGKKDFLAGVYQPAGLKLWSSVL